MNAQSLDESGAQGLWAMFFCHDTFGLAHVRRTLTLSHYFQAIHPDISLLILRGSPVASALTYPDCPDLIEIPSVTKDRAGGFTSRIRGRMPFDGIRDLRRSLILAAAKRHRPDLFFVEGSVQS